MKNLRQRHGERQSDFDRLIDGYLQRIQTELAVDEQRKVVAIHVETGEYVLGDNHAEAMDAYKKRWPNGGFYVCRVDGTPALRM